ncbi:MAG: bifunctional oligoribonuclease/PAP phosphatase NrnA [Marinilabiliaceae bacterium]|nr:bifunctional oligoribonuclease/PAP phosphatase NrnA [Marinilabiliaceae bacterium]
MGIDAVYTYDIAGLKSAISEHNSFVLTCHLNPDGDALGSTLGLRHVLRQMGKEATVITPDLPPTNLMWIPGAKGIRTYERDIEACDAIIDAADCIIMMDFNELTRLKQLGNKLSSSKKFTILVDHHLDPIVKCDVMISNPKASATAEIIFSCLRDMSFIDYIDVRAATCFYIGIMTDTGGLSYNSSDPNLYILIAELLKRGVDKDSVHDMIFNNKSLRRLRLMGYALNRKTMRIGDLPVSLMTLSREELDKYKYNTGDTEGFVNFPLQAKNIICSIFLMERPDGIKISLRSKGDFSVSEFAQHYYKGGGHFNASGATYHGTFDDACETVKRDMIEYCEGKLNKTQN